jgi:hypothetical protein
MPLLPEHMLVVGMHATHAPARQLGRSPEQGAPTGCQVPDAVHVSGWLLSHDCSPKEQPPLRASGFVASELVTSAWWASSATRASAGTFASSGDEASREEHAVHSP